MGWIGVDLDGTLAEYNGWAGPENIGAPVPKMLERVKAWRREGKEVRIFTARITHDGTVARIAEAGIAESAIKEWLEINLGEKLPIVCCKDYKMDELWDDRVVQVEKNTGRIVGENE